MSKGSGRRPNDVDEITFASNWEKAFSKKPVKTEIELCNYCDEPVDGVGAGDECLYFCHDCDMIVEGNTHTVRGIEL